MPFGLCGRERKAPPIVRDVISQAFGVNVLLNECQSHATGIPTCGMHSWRIERTPNVSTLRRCRPARLGTR